MTYVIDSSVAYKWYVAESESDIAERLRIDWVSGAVKLHAPDLFPLEVLNSLTKAERRKIKAIGSSLRDWVDLTQFSPALHEPDQFIPRAYDISSTMQIGTFDCVYVAIAGHYGCEFITADQRLLNALQHHFPFVIPLSAYP